jgi:3-oxoacyl-[acyl-carrier-protein] synthase-3
MIRSCILGIGKAVPEKVLDNAYFESHVETTDEWILSRTGIRERRALSDGERISDFGAASIRAACANAGLDAAEVDMIIACTYTPDAITPSTACNIQHAMGLKSIPCVDLNAACSGFIYGLEMADALVRTGKYRRVAVVGLDAQTRWVDYSDRNTCILFGDAAGAAIIGPVEDGSDRGILSTFVGAEACGGTMIRVKHSGSAEPVREEDVRERRNRIFMNGRDVFKFAVRILGFATDKALERAGLTAADIDLLVPHQANIRIIESAAERYGMPPERVVRNVEKYGNTSAASIPLALCDAVESGQMRRGQTVALVAFGSGLTYGASIMRW